MSEQAHLEPARKGRRRVRDRALRIVASAAVAVTVLTVAACGGSSKHTSSSTAKTNSGTTTANSGAGVASSTSAAASNVCPQVVDWSSVDFYPIQPSFSAGYQLFAQRNDSSTAHVGYVLSGDFPYSNWMAWYVYTLKGVPTAKLADSDIKPDSGSTNPTVNGNPVLASPRAYTIDFMPAATPSSVISSMRSAGKNVMLLPPQKGAANGTPSAAIVGRSYWPFSGYNRSGYQGPTNTPFPELRAYQIASDGTLTNTPVSCAFHTGASNVPAKLAFDVATAQHYISFVHAPKQVTYAAPRDLPDQLVFTGGEIGRQKAPRPNPEAVSFYRNPIVAAPYADVESVPGYGNPPDACGGYVMADLLNNHIALVRIPKVPTFANYANATSSTLNNSSRVNVQFYSVVLYGATKQVDKPGSPQNSQIGNTEILKDATGGATVVVYPPNISESQLNQIVALAHKNGWNILHGGTETAFAPDAMVVREKGQNKNWKYALSANPVTPGAPCPQTTNTSLDMTHDPPSAAVTQHNGMGLTAPQGAECTINEFLNGTCLTRLKNIISSSGGVYSSTSNSSLAIQSSQSSTQSTSSSPQPIAIRGHIPTKPTTAARETSPPARRRVVSAGVGPTWTDPYGREDDVRTRPMGSERRAPVVTKPQAGRSSARLPQRRGRYRAYNSPRLSAWVTGR
jgi:hypothetical protein